MFFFINYINNFLKNLLNNIFILFDNIHLEYYYRLQNEFIFKFNTQYFLKYFKVQFFEVNYIFY